MFEIGLKYKRTTITKRNQEEILFYECLFVGKDQSFFNAHLKNGETKEVLLPNLNIKKFILITDIVEEKIQYLNKVKESIQKEIDNLIYKMNEHQSQLYIRKREQEEINSEIERIKIEN